MQNSGLASALALQFFTPEAALPGVVAAVWSNITGAVFAVLVRRKPLAGESVLASRWEIGQPCPK